MYQQTCTVTHARLVSGICPWCGEAIVLGKPIGTPERHVRERMGRLATQVRELVASHPGQAEFCSRFLHSLLDALAAPAGSLWVRDNRGASLEYSWNRHAAAPRGPDDLIQEVFADPRPQLVWPGASGDGATPTEAAIGSVPRIVAPIMVDGAAHAVVEVIFQTGRRKSALEKAVRLVSDLCLLAGEYWQFSPGELPE